MVTGIVKNAPLSLPSIVNVHCNDVCVLNRVLIVVAVILIVVPTTVLDTDVPIVVVWFAKFKAVTAGVLIPTPSNVLNLSLIHI